ncbi:MAG: hypothetical protein K6G40_07425 [Eubacterium sp.]|nr:hypothetical protein [Eubacterium sp.]
MGKKLNKLLMVMCCAFVFIGFFGQSVYASTGTIVSVSNINLGSSGSGVQASGSVEAVVRNYTYTLDIPSSKSKLTTSYVQSNIKKSVKNYVTTLAHGRISGMTCTSVSKSSTYCTVTFVVNTVGVQNDLYYYPYGWCTLKLKFYY